MAAPASELPPAEAPAWPGAPGQRVIFLLDAASPLEERQLVRWIERNRPSGLEPGDVETLRLPSSRRRSRAGLGALEPALATPDDPLLAPLRIAWVPPERDGGRSVRFSDLLRLGDPRDPGRWRERWILRAAPDRCRVVVAQPAPLSELRERWRSAAGTHVEETIGLAGFVARQALRALDRAERRLRGARYKVPRFVHEEILGRPAFQGGIARLAQELGRKPKALQRDAARVLREIAATHSPLMIDLFAEICRSSSTRGYEALRIDPAQVDQIRVLAQQHPLVFLPTHKSNLDHPVLRRLLHEQGLPPNHTAGGINMNFFPMGAVMRRAGIFFIRRTFKDDELYKFVLRSYIDFLIEKRFPLEWYIEGGRSRSGKLLPPRYGLLHYVVDAYRRGKSDDVMLIPVSIAYDQISDVGDYAAEQRGAKKEKESFRWFLRVLRRLGRQYGSIDLRFGEALSLRQALGAPRPEHAGASDTPDLTVQKLAFEVCARINRVTPITPISVAMLALLGSGDRALSISEIRASLSNLVRYVTRRGLPTTERLAFDTPAEIRRVLDPLVTSGVLTRFDEGREVIYSIRAGQHLAAAYYRNTVIHFLINGALGELALLGAAEAEVDSRSAFWEELLRLRDLLKFEFFFSEKDEFREEIRQELSLQVPGWEERLDDPRAPRELLAGIRPFHAHRTLRPFLEAYGVVADRLVALGEEPAGDEAALLKECLAWGRQYALQRRIRNPESVSRVLLQNGLKLARHRRLLDAGNPELHKQREAFAHELAVAIRRVDAIDGLASARRAGALA